MSKGIIKSVCSVFIFLFLIASSALAAQPEVTILTVSVDLDAQTITVTGENFDIGPDPTTVSLGGFGNLNITTNTGNLIIADLPGGIPAGDYVLSVSSGPGKRKNDEKSITIGAQGPQGDMGDPGTPGDPGDQGDQGDQGPQGPQGPQGATGPQGPQGPQGATGPQGVPGPAGADGADGQDGQDGEDGLSCWDTNGNGIGEPDEDINTDGNYDTLDCMGPEGLQGIQGEVGPQGPAGSMGAQGEQGAEGPAGPQGEEGPAGPAGADGMDGADGQDGQDGADGQDGQDGADGALANLTCAIGQIAQFDGTEWVCADMVMLTDAIDAFAKLVFGTSISYDGNLLGQAINNFPDCAGVTTGLDAADCICQEHADSAGFDGLYAAWLADNTGSPDTRFVKSFSQPYYTTDGRLIANDWTDLTDGSIANKINKTENAGNIPGANIWTNVKIDGTMGSSTNNCGDWTVNSGASNRGRLGSKGATDDSWTDNGFITNCSAAISIYCFEQ